jgi:hypothetical protein
MRHATPAQTPPQGPAQSPPQGPAQRPRQYPDAPTKAAARRIHAAIATYPLYQGLGRRSGYPGLWIVADLHAHPEGYHTARRDICSRISAADGLFLGGILSRPLARPIA